MNYLRFNQTIHQENISYNDAFEFLMQKAVESGRPFEWLNWLYDFDKENFCCGIKFAFFSDTTYFVRCEGEEITRGYDVDELGQMYQIVIKDNELCTIYFLEDNLVPKWKTRYYITEATACIKLDDLISADDEFILEGLCCNNLTSNSERREECYDDLQTAKDELSGIVDANVIPFSTGDIEVSIPCIEELGVLGDFEDTRYHSTRYVNYQQNTALLVRKVKDYMRNFYMKKMEICKEG